MVETVSLIFRVLTEKISGVPKFRNFTIYAVKSGTAEAKLSTIKFLNFRTPKIIAVSYLKFKHRGQTSGNFVKMVQREWQTVKTLIRLLPLEQSDLGLHCLPRLICPKT